MSVSPGSPRSAPGGTAPAGPNLRALKILVVVMGIAIVASVIVIVVAISNRLSEAEQAAPAEAATAPAKVIGDLSIAIPEGCVMAEADVQGSRLVVRIDGLAERGCQQVILIDLASGRVLTRVTAEPGG